jgi:DNA polymerase-1
MADADNRVHTVFNQALSATGRLSSTNPNLQNIPIRTPRGSAIRQAFIAAKGKNLISADYSQVELRILAHITDDPGLVAAFNKDLDIHTATASEVFGVNLDSVTPELRRTAKAINFGIAYGQGAFGLSETLGIPRAEATDIIEKYFKKFSNVKEYMESTIRDAHSKGYVETIFGRRRYLPELRSKNPNLKKFGERAAINAPIQGAASDLVKLAMIHIRSEIADRMVLQVHDELLFEVKAEECEEVMIQIKRVMESAYAMRVPLKVNVAAALNWEEAH